MQETRICPYKVCSTCPACKTECYEGLLACTQTHRSNCTEGYTNCTKELFPCEVAFPPATPAPTIPFHKRDMALITALTQEALTLTNGVYFATAPHKLPYEGVTTIGKGEFLQSPSGVYVLQFQDNGDLGLFAGNIQLWKAFRTENRGVPGHIEFDPTTGVMYMYSSTNTLWWSSLEVFRLIRIMDDWPFPRVIPHLFNKPKPNGNAPYQLVITDNGNVEIVDILGKVFFETATSDQGLLIADITATADYATGQTTSPDLISFLST